MKKTVTNKKKSRNNKTATKKKRKRQLSDDEKERRRSRRNENEVKLTKRQLIQEKDTFGEKQPKSKHKSRQRQNSDGK